MCWAFHLPPFVSFVQKLKTIQWSARCQFLCLCMLWSFVPVQLTYAKETLSTFTNDKYFPLCWIVLIMCHSHICLTFLFCPVYYSCALSSHFIPGLILCHVVQNNLGWEVKPLCGCFFVNRGFILCFLWLFQIVCIPTILNNLCLTAFIWWLAPFVSF